MALHAHTTTHTQQPMPTTRKHRNHFHTRIRSFKPSKLRYEIKPQFNFPTSPTGSTSPTSMTSQMSTASSSQTSPSSTFVPPLSQSTGNASINQTPTIPSPNHQQQANSSTQQQASTTATSSAQPQSTTQSTTAPAAANEAATKLAEALDDFLGDVERKFKGISEEILARLDEMAERCDRLEGELVKGETAGQQRSAAVASGKES